MRKLTRRIVLCDKGDIYRVWPCSDFKFRNETNNALDRRYGTRRYNFEVRKSFPEVGRPCNQIFCVNYHRAYFVSAGVVSNETLG